MPEIFGFHGDKDSVLLLCSDVVRYQVSENLRLQPNACPKYSKYQVYSFKVTSYSSILHHIILLAGEGQTEAGQPISHEPPEPRT